MDDNAIITLESNKLVLTKDAIQMLDATADDRISVNYYTVDSEHTFPVIGKSELFTDKNDGNRLTKSNTVSFRGSQNEILSMYGKCFKLESFKTFFKMIPIEEDSENDNLQEEILDLNNLN